MEIDHNKHDIFKKTNYDNPKEEEIFIVVLKILQLNVVEKVGVNTIFFEIVSNFLIENFYREQENKEIKDKKGVKKVEIVFIVQTKSKNSNASSN